MISSLQDLVYVPARFQHLITRPLTHIVTQRSDYPSGHTAFVMMIFNGQTYREDIIVPHLDLEDARAAHERYNDAVLKAIEHIMTDGGVQPARTRPRRRVAVEELGAFDPSDGVLEPNPRSI